MKPLIVSIDDSVDDALLLERACQKASVQFELEIFDDGQRALEFLGTLAHGETSADRLALILIDLNMPGKTGFEILTWIRGQARLARVPIVMFTSSENDSDVIKAHARGADYYCAKPADFLSLVKMVHSLDESLARPAEERAAALRTIAGFRFKALNDAARN